MSSTFKVGDVCRILEDYPFFARLRKGETVQVIEVKTREVKRSLTEDTGDGYTYSVIRPSLTGSSEKYWFVGSQHMELVEDGPGEEDARVVTDANPKQAYGDKKLPFHLVPPAATAFISLGLRDGAVKYGPWNWRETNVEAMTYIGAIKRHLDAWVDGEELATDSGVPHLAHAIAGLSILIDAMTSDRMIDNRPPKGAVPEVLEGWKLEEPPKE